MAFPYPPIQADEITIEVALAYYRHFYLDNMSELAIQTQDIPEDAQRCELNLLDSLVRAGSTTDNAARKQALVETWNDVVLTAYTAQAYLLQAISDSLRAHIGRDLAKAHHWDGDYQQVKEQCTRFNREAKRASEAAKAEHEQWKPLVKVAEEMFERGGGQETLAWPWLRGLHLQEMQEAIDIGLDLLKKVDLSRLSLRKLVLGFLVDDAWKILAGGALTYLLLYMFQSQPL